MAELTICIPAYKAAGTIGETLKSLQVQTDKDFKTIVVLDGPDPETKDAIKQNRGLLDLDIVELKKNGGCGHARNAGLDHCDTKYIAWLDADDLYMPYAVDQINQAIAAYFDWYAGKFIQRTPRGYYIRGNEHNTWMHGRVYNVDFLKYHKIRCPDENRIADDFPFNILCREFGVTVREGDLPIALYRPNESSATLQADARLKQALEYIKGNMHYVRTAMRERPAEKLNQLPQVIVMSYFYLDFAVYMYMIQDVKKREEDFKALAEYVDLEKLLKNERFEAMIDHWLLTPSRPYPDNPIPPQETFMDMLQRLEIVE